MANQFSGKNGFPVVGAVLGGSVAQLCRNSITVILNCGYEAYMLYGDTIPDRVLEIDDDVVVEVISVADGRHGGLSIKVAEVRKAA